MWERRLEGLPNVALCGGIGLAVADAPLARLAGLAGMRALPEGTGLLIPRCRSVHTFGMRFALDLVWLDRDGQIVDVSASVRPRRVVSRGQARAVVEAPAGTGAVFFTALVGAADRLTPYLRGP
jgi:uncharacterized membrane protein (UPF0127 family)